MRLLTKVVTDSYLKKLSFKKFMIFEIILKIFNLKNVKLATKVAVDSCLKEFFFKKFVNF